MVPDKLDLDNWHELNRLCSGRRPKQIRDRLEITRRPRPHGAEIVDGQWRLVFRCTSARLRREVEGLARQQKERGS